MTLPPSPSPLLPKPSPAAPRTTAATPAVLLFSLIVFAVSAVIVIVAAAAAAYSPNLNSSLVLAAGFIFASLVLVVASRAVMVTWITVLVLLAFAGKRRRVLVQHGQKITTDIVVNLFRCAA
ncbi:unnamed protein product [Linum tenue]|uniref:Uncharacterized protein n=1 Tax=Linum tenue TaxID=586396 RepID=A0AAV0N6L6_9ROSI|nr:unnamed protein product [Linum tenue]